MCSVAAPHVLRGPGFNDCAPVSGRDPSEQAPRVAARALSRARSLEHSGLFEDALLNLRVVEATLPRIADHIALMRAELHEHAEDPARAASAYEDAAALGTNLDLTARSRVGRVRNLLRAQDPAGPDALRELLIRYPSLPEMHALRFELGRYHERRGDLRAAVAVYRELDLKVPGHGAAEHARQRLGLLAAQGHPIPAYSFDEQLDRAERLVSSGPFDLAHAVIAQLASEESLPSALKARLDALRERIGDRTATVSDLDMLAADAVGVADRAVRQKLAASVQGAKLRQLHPRRMITLLEEATRLGDREVSSALVGELVRRERHVPAGLRFDALAVAVGAASDEALIGLADTLLEHRSYGVAARYHRARALERLGRIDEAQRDLWQVVELDDSATHFYRHWAEQRLAMLSDVVVRCFGAGRKVDCNRQAVEDTLRALEVEADVDVPGAMGLLEGLATEHGVAYPWLTRALDLLYLGEVDAASDEVHQVYLAYRGAVRASAIRAGLTAIYRGGVGALHTTRDPLLLRARRALGPSERAMLAEVASKLGDVGTAAFFGGMSWAESHPRPYAAEVARVARKYELDPDLLFAVMRVESVYQRRIISHAGAIGLMQIMPRTGRLIGNRLGRADTTASDLLDPSINLEFSAWYLSSLLERMGGRLPLAIASYNGGPHNVRRWIREFGEHIPLDAFLERIPFRETKRYVRRVLSYYAEYRAERGRKLDLMALSLPKDRPDIVSF